MLHTSIMFIDWKVQKKRNTLSSINYLKYKIYLKNKKNN